MRARIRKVKKSNKKQRVGGSRDPFLIVSGVQDIVSGKVLCVENGRITVGEQNKGSKYGNHGNENKIIKTVITWAVIITPKVNESIIMMVIGWVGI